MRKRWSHEACRRGLAFAAWIATCGVGVGGPLGGGAGCSKPKRQPLVVVDAGAPPAPPVGPRITSLNPPARASGQAPVLPEPVMSLPLREAFTVDDAGAEPRRLVRYALDAKARRVTLAAKLTARAFSGDAAQPAPTQIPPFRERFTVQVEKRAGKRDRFSWRGEPITVEGDAAAATTATPYVLRWKQLLANRNATFTLDDQFFPRDITFAEDPLREHSAPEREELTQRLLGQLVPLPATPIGKGARWTAVTILRQGFAAVKQTASYQLVAIDGDRLTVAVDVRRIGEEQLVELPDVPAGAQVELLALFRATTGTLAVELGAALPVSGELAIEARSHQRLTTAEGQVSELITEDLGSLQWSGEVLD